MGDEPRQQSPEVVVGDADVRVCADVETLCDRLAEAIAGQVVQASGPVSLALTGGVTSARVYARLGQAHAAVRWSDVDFFWSDERLVPCDDPASNFRGAYGVWLNAAQVPEAKLHRPDVDAADPDKIADAYAAEIRRCLGPGLSFDCVLLSVGKDGHVASLFPGHPATAETDRLVVPVLDSPKPPPRRVTMTLPLINRARRIHLLAVGRAKAAALRATLEDGVAPGRWPVHGVRPRTGHLTVWADRAAAGDRPTDRGDS